MAWDVESWDSSEPFLFAFNKMKGILYWALAQKGNEAISRS